MTNAGKELIKSKNAEFGEMLDLAMLQTVYLFGLSQYEQGAPVDYNPSFLMLAENLSNAPGVKKGEGLSFSYQKRSETKRGWITPSGSNMMR